MSHTPIGGHPQGWDKLADRSSLPPASGEEKSKSQKHVFTQPNLPKMGGACIWREQTEGSTGSSHSASPPYMRWARSLHDLLEDAEGVRLFRKWVCSAGGVHVDRLNFYFAVHGLRQETDPHKIRQVVSAIYKFVRKSQLAMPEELRVRVKSALKDGSDIDRTVFDHMEQEVTTAITQTTYQTFLRSDAYVSYVSAATQPLSSPSASPPPMHQREAALSSLATLHEGEELDEPPPAPPAGAPLPPARLTHDALLATQSRRLHAAPAVKGHHRSVYSAHVTYGGYCPASRQDSSRGSVSSGRSHSDAISLSGSSIDGGSVRGSREYRDSRHRRLPGLDKHAVMNRELDTNMVIPRTQRMQSEQLRVLPPGEFAPLLIEKLERVKKDQDAKERRDRRLVEGDGEDASIQALPPQLVAAAIREKLQLDDDNDQDILDQHVSRVWSERTPGASPPGGRRARRMPASSSTSYATSTTARRAPSALSADSGLYDAPPSHHSHSLYSHPSHSLHRRVSMKSGGEIGDSGVSVVSEGTAFTSGAGSGGGIMGGSGSGTVDGRVLQWVAAAAGAGGRQHLQHSRASSAERREKRNRGSGSKSSSTSASGGTAAAVMGAMATEHTVVVISFLDEPMPYRLKVPAFPLTLKTFKDYLPRKGNYRYFFKTECADLDNTVIQEEVSSDNDTLPMFEGKVMARVKTIE